MRRVHAGIGALLLVLLLSFGLRVHALGAQSLWNDEGSSYVQATRTFSEIAVNAAADIHPPGYYWALKVWRGLAGETEFALRYLSVLAGVLTVAFTVGIGRRLRPGGRGWIIGGLAGLLVAANTFQITYSQEARMYAALALWGAASMWVLVGFLDGLRWRDGLLLGVFNALGLWTQYAFPFVMLVQGGVAVLALARHRSRWAGLWRYVVVNLLALALFAPLLPTALRQVTTWPNTGDGTPFPVGLGMIVGWFTFGVTAPETNVTWVAVALILFLWSLRTDHAAFWKTVLPALWAVLPPAIFLAAGLFREGNLKFLLPSQVGYALAVAAGAAAVWDVLVKRGQPAHDATTLVTVEVVRVRRGRWLVTAVARGAVILAVGGLLWHLAVAVPPLYTEAAYQRDDYRGIVAAIAPQLDLGDAVILNAPGQSEVFGYYYRGDIAPLPIPRGINSSDEEIRADVEAAIANAEDIFVVLWGEAERDPRRVVESTLDANAYEVGNTWYGDVRLARYVTEADWFNITGEPGAQFGEDITLNAYAVSEGTAGPGDVVQIRLEWETQAPLDTRYKVFVQLLDEGGELAAQRDAEPGGGLALTTTWEPGQAVIDNHALMIPQDLPESHYRLIIGLYNPSDAGARLPVTLPVGGPDNPQDYFTLTTIRVINPSGG